MNEERIVIDRGGESVITLIIQPFDTELNLDDILRIDYSNIMGEILTFPLIFNRVANLKADMENLMSVSRMDLDVFLAQMFDEKRKAILAKGEKATEALIDAEVKQDARYAMRKKQHYQIVKNYNYIDSLYWSAQSKDTKLNRLSEKITPQEFERELVEGTINGVMIKSTKKVIQ